MNPSNPMEKVVASLKGWIREQDALNGEKTGRIWLEGLAGSALSFLVAARFLQSERHQILVAKDKESAAYLNNDLENILSPNSSLFFPETYRRAYDQPDVDNANVLLRAEALNRIREKRPLCLVTYPEAICEKVVSRTQLEARSHRIAIGDRLDMDFLFDLLVSYDFERDDLVYEPGQFALRGGLMDVFSFAHNQPFRLEFEGDSIADIRFFDPESQLSHSSVNEVVLLPSIEQKTGVEERKTLLEFIGNQAEVWIYDARDAAVRMDKKWLEAQTIYKELNSPVKRASPEELVWSGQAFTAQLLSQAYIQFEAPGEPSDVRCRLQAKSQPVFNKKYNLFQEHLAQLAQEKTTVLMFYEQEPQRDRLIAIFQDQFQLGADQLPFIWVKRGLSQGVLFPELGWACYTDHELFERYRRFRIKSRYSKQQAASIRELSELQPGDYVTHIDHGVCRFAGLEIQDNGGKKQEVIKLLFKDGDAVFVSLQHLHRISRHSGRDAKAPSLSKLGTTAWANMKSKAKARVKALAYDLLKLYAQRQNEKGHAFSPDNYLMHELEGSFSFEETEDQAKAIREVKADMEKIRPMDRLVCGDVGFGKTEVAVRASFKAVCDNKQVAVLVPTTILALQHYKTFEKRYAGLPCRVEYINRFRSSAEQKQILADLASGKVDVLIGTHKLLGQEVKFKDLGLLIIDEEQKFGVNAKDKLKTLKVNVDTLTLSATPIPRTLQFSLLGARDLSVIRTPPGNRYPILTELKGFNEEFIRDALYHELERGGQVFFLHNRIQNLPEIAGMLQRLVPEARIRYAHGQMDGKALEEIMLEFIRGDFDVLVSTSIIENGLDVPNANTILINEAHSYGLSDLHQMRGRVGRGNRKAYCYLITPPFHALADESKRRLQALIEFSDLGSGFLIAMKDLDIRGAGDLLGADQSGFVNEMGYETYQRVLVEAIQELKEEAFAEEFKEELNSEEHRWAADCQIDTDLPLLLPETYVDNMAERLALYKELDSLQRDHEIEGFETRLRDRFGPLPAAAQDLLLALKLRLKAQSLGIERIVLKNGQLQAGFPGQERAAYYNSGLFTSILQQLGTRRDVEMKQQKNRLMLYFKNVIDIAGALKQMDALLPQNTAQPV